MSGGGSKCHYNIAIVPSVRNDIYQKEWPKGHPMSCVWLAQSHAWPKCQRMIFNRENTRAERFVQQSLQVYWLRNLNTVGI